MTYKELLDSLKDKLGEDGMLDESVTDLTLFDYLGLCDIEEASLHYETLLRDMSRRKTLPRPNVVMATQKPSTEAEVAGTLCNPIYAGVGPFPAIIPEEKWVQAAAMRIREDGADQFLVNMLHVLRASFGSNAGSNGSGN